MAKKSSDSPAASSRFTDTQRVKELVALMAENGLSEIELVEDKSKILLRRGSADGAPAVAPVPVYQAPAGGSAPAAQASAPPASSAASNTAGLVPLKSPMVGVFYAAPSPDASPFVSVGSAVDEKTVVCTIESMKHFNQILAEMRGTVAKVLAANGQVVEFDQPLFLIKPD